MSIVPILLPKPGDGFSLREFDREDAECLAEIEFDSDVKQFLALPVKGKADWVATFDPTSYNGRAIEVDGVLAGRASLLRGKHLGDGELAIVIGRPFWGLKLGRKVAAMLIHAAFDELDARALVAEVHPCNSASISLLRAFKFRRRGVVAKPPQHWQHGHFVYRMSLGSYKKVLATVPQLQAAASPQVLRSDQRQS